MQSLLVALIAVAGTLGGSLVTGLLQHRQAAKLELAARTERVRRERLAAYSTFVGAIVEFRRWQIRRGWIKRDHEPTEVRYIDTKDACDQARTAARSALLGLQLLPADESALNAARASLAAAIRIEDAADTVQLNQLSEVAREAVEAFADMAARLERPS